MCKILLATATGALLTGSSAAADGYFDLLLGIGDFEKCTFSRVSGYDHFGIIPPSNLRVAEGWVAAINLKHEDQYTFSIVDSSTFADHGVEHMQPDTKYQYIGVPNSAGYSLQAQFYVGVESVAGFTDETFAPGDKLTFHIDRLIASNCNSPTGQIVSMGMFYKLEGGETQYLKKIDLDVSRGVVENATVVLDLPGVRYVRPFVQIWVDGSAAPAKTSGVLLGGARLWKQRVGEMVIYPEETIPYPRNRTVNTHRILYNASALPPRPAAKRFDALAVHSKDYLSFGLFRKLNPNIKLYITLFAGAVESKDLPMWSTSPLNISYVAANHSDWLYPQSSVAQDVVMNPLFPDSPYAASYLNAAWEANRFLTRFPNSQYRKEWTDAVVANARAVGADGVWIDDAQCIKAERSGATRETWEVQQLLHTLMPKIHAAGLECVYMDVLANLDGSQAYSGCYPKVLLDPMWQPNAELTERMGYSANTPDNTPDVCYNEHSFMYNDHRYNREYWLKCVNDASIIAAWNTSLPGNRKKRLFYDVGQTDTLDHPALNASGKAGWAMFTFASFLLCQNEYTSFGATHGGAGNYADAGIDYSLTTRLGVPSGLSRPVGSSPYFRMRDYAADGSGGVGGVVVVNADTTTQMYTLPYDAVDESGVTYPAATRVALLPNMGKIFVKAGTLNTEIVTASSTVTPGQTVDITVRFKNASSVPITNLIVQAVVPAEMTYVAGSAESTGGKYVALTRTVSWTVRQVAAGGSGTRTFKAKVR